MPQTREHLAILHLLGVERGIVALTKIDLLDDPDWLELVTLEVDETLAQTTLAAAPIIPVSARTGVGLDRLIAALSTMLAQTPARPDLGRPRLPVDRVFSLPGFGTIVTGTLVDGRFRVGDAVEILPSGVSGRIRGLQTHQSKLEVAQPGSRVAINLSGIERSDLMRGEVAAAPGTLRNSVLLDVGYTHLADAAAPLGHNMAVKLFVGAAEVMARTRVLGQEAIAPGAEGWLQLVLAGPVAVARGDRYILRQPSPGMTLGGGRVLDPHPGRRYRRFRPEVAARMETLAAGTPSELLLDALHRRQPPDRPALFGRSTLGAATAAKTLEQLLAGGQVVEIGQQVMTRDAWKALQEQAVQIVGEYHRQAPLRLGIGREALRSRLKIPAALFGALLDHLAAAGMLVVVGDGTAARLPAHTIQFDAQQEAAVARLMERFAAAGVNSPSVKESKAAVGEAVYSALLDLGMLHPLNEEVVYATAGYEVLVERLRDYLRENGRIDAAETRDLLGTTRKYAIALLEHLDDLRVTRRVGDERELVGK
jgi:selenocysteine-specific elongation factor